LNWLNPKYFFNSLKNIIIYDSVLTNDKNDTLLVEDSIETLTEIITGIEIIEFSKE
jgi:hypothetical protein